MVHYAGLYYARLRGDGTLVRRPARAAAMASRAMMLLAALSAAGPARAQTAPTLAAPTLAAPTPAAPTPAAPAPAAPADSVRATKGAGASGTDMSGVALSPPLKASDLDQSAHGASDPVVGSVDGHLIYLSDLGNATQALPANLRDLPFDMLFPVLLDRMVDHESLVLMARRKGLDENPAVKREIQAATDRILEGAYLGTTATPKVTEQAILARYNRDYANRPATEEVRARHILVGTEQEARTLIADLKHGDDFATLARQYSKDPDGANGGDLGFFRREQVWPSFADLAFSMQPGQVAPNPIKNEFGWHVVKVEERRLVAPPSYSDMREPIRQQLMQEAVQEAIRQARAQMTIHKFNLDGTEMDAGLRLGSSASAQSNTPGAPAPKVAPLPR